MDIGRERREIDVKPTEVDVPPKELPQETPEKKPEPQPAGV